jgi:hypothetical protein
MYEITSGQNYSYLLKCTLSTLHKLLFANKVSQ